MRDICTCSVHTCICVAVVCRYGASTKSAVIRIGLQEMWRFVSHYYQVMPINIYMYKCPIIFGVFYMYVYVVLHCLSQVSESRFCHVPNPIHNLIGYMISAGLYTCSHLFISIKQYGART